MTDLQETAAGPRVLGPQDGDRSQLGGVVDRFMIDGRETDQRFALVQHLFEPRSLAAPMHRHHDEDEFTYVLSGQIGAVLDGHEVLASPGDLLFKPRGQWHTFWNPGDEPAAVLELISPAGLENLFRWFVANPDPAPDRLSEMAATYHCDLDFEATMPLLERHGIEF